MSRSRRKTPMGGSCIADSEKQFKRKLNRYFRRTSKSELDREPEGALPMNIRKETELWDGPKDGKSRFDPKENPKLMRK